MQKTTIIGKWDSHVIAIISFALQWTWSELADWEGRLERLGVAELLHSGQSKSGEKNAKFYLVQIDYLQEIMRLTF